MPAYLWTPADDYWLETNAKNLTLKQMQSRFKISKDSIRNRCIKLGLKWKRSPSSGRPLAHWTGEEEKILLDGVKANLSYVQIAKQIPGKTPPMCERKYLRMRKNMKKERTICLKQILEAGLTEGQKQTAISLFERSPIYAENYIKNIQRYRNKDNAAIPRVD